MAYNVLGINPGHNGSAAIVSDGKLVFYLEEERLSRLKYDAQPFRVILEHALKYKIDRVVIGGTNDPKEHVRLPYSKTKLYHTFINKFFTKNIPIYDEAYKTHHLLHGLSSYLNSNFNESIILVLDGAGSFQTMQENHYQVAKGWETESIFYVDSNNNFNTIYKKYGRNDPFNKTTSSNNIFIDDSLGITKVYEAVTKELGWLALEAGKTMGLSPYGKHNPDIPTLIKNGIGNKNLFTTDYPGGGDLHNKEEWLKESRYFSNKFHKNPDKLHQNQADLAWKVQKETQEEVLKLVKKSIELTNVKNVCISGGFGLNCVNNYYLKKNLPDINFHIDPMSNDGGTAIGAAYYGWLNYSKDLSSNTISNIYFGPKYSLKKYKNAIKNYNEMFNSQKITPKEVAKLISERNIVTIFQGRSEAGPRALGNRSILYDPTDPNGKDFVNKVKKREWFRPFAGTVLLEKAHEYFDMAGLEESPFMMYAMDVWPDKQEQIQAITHVDGTCRIQTVTEKQNPHYYKLIQEFEKITGVPILFNTSFNLAGDPLVETIEDALETLLKSELKYLYLPELEMLLEKK